LFIHQHNEGNEMKKATHEGTCQVCGAAQKLPAGKLAKHGYTTRWGFFEGVCEGAGHLPFEQSMELIAAAILRVTARAVELRTAAATARADTANVWVHEWHRATGAGRYYRPGYHAWRQLAVADVTFEGWWIAYTNHEGKQERAEAYGNHTLAEVVAKLNAGRAAAFEAHAVQADAYIKWQQGRIKNWKPAPLTPVAADTGPTVHAIGAYWSKQVGRPVAACAASRMAADKWTRTTANRAEVTCARCLKRLADRAEA
jgi:hypothetical protein